MFTENFLHARDHSKHFICIQSLEPHKISTGRYVIHPHIMNKRPRGRKEILTCPSSSTSKRPILYTTRVVAIPFFKGSSWPRHWSRVHGIAGRFFTTEPTIKPPLSYYWTLNASKYTFSLGDLGISFLINKNRRYF